MAEIVLAFKMNEVYGEGVNCVDRMGWYTGPKFADDGGTIASDLYVRHDWIWSSANQSSAENLMKICLQQRNIHLL